MYEVEKLFWWNDMPNFGDAISPEIVTHILGVKLPCAKQGDSNVLLSVGSIIHRTSDFDKPIVWGSGCELMYGKPHRDAIYLAVRGPKTRDYLGLDPLPLGDPGFLMPRIYPRELESSNEIGIVIHRSTAKKRMREIFFDPYRTSYNVIDPRKNWREVIDEICRSRFVFCQSLHGAIIAQAYGVPWAWWRGFYGYFITFKWLDFFGSIGVKPKSFRLGQLKAAERWAATIQAQTPNLDDLAGALSENVRVITKS